MQRVPGTSTTPFLYDGRDGVMTDTNGLYYMRARYYNPEIMRFINRDVLLGSVQDTLSLNRFAYVQGNPISHIDPEGKVAMLITMGAGAAIGAIIGAVGNVVSQGLDKGWGNINGKEVLINAGTGFISGAVAGSGVGLLYMIGINAGLGSINYAGTQLVNNKEITDKGLAFNFGIGGVAGAIGGSGMLNGEVGKEVASIEATKALAKFLGIQSGQEIADMSLKEVASKAIQINVLRSMGVAGWSFSANYASSDKRCDK